MKTRENCQRTSHTLSGDAFMLSMCLGISDTCNGSIAGFSFACADQNEEDYEVLRTAIRDRKFYARFEE